MMDRLTKRVGTGEAVTVGDFDPCKPFQKAGECKTGYFGGFPSKWRRGCDTECLLGRIIDKLAAYEDAAPLEEVRELMRAGRAAGIVRENN